MGKKEGRKEKVLIRYVVDVTTGVAGKNRLQAGRTRYTLKLRSPRTQNLPSDVIPNSETKKEEREKNKKRKIDEGRLVMAGSACRN